MGFSCSRFLRRLPDLPELLLTRRRLCETRSRSRILRGQREVEEGLVKAPTGGGKRLHHEVPLKIKAAVETGRPTTAVPGAELRGTRRGGEHTWSLFGGQVAERQALLHAGA